MVTPVVSSLNIKTAWLLDWYMSDIDRWAITTAPFNITANSLTYLASPLPLSIGRLADTAKVSDTELSISFSGINLNFKAAALNAVLTGRPFNVYRVIFNTNYSIDQIVQRYAGVIASVTFDEDYPSTIDNRGDATFTVTFNLKSIKEMLKNRVSGRYTNRADQQRFFPTDNSMNLTASEQGRTIILGKE